MPATDAVRNLVVLYAPHYAAGPDRHQAVYRAVPPMAQLALAGPLRDAGYEVRILDARWDANWRDLIASWIDRMVCLGVGSLTGPAVTDGLEVAAYTRTLKPALPIVWGGWHATFAADQAIRDSRVDVVVRGIAERTFVDLLAAFRDGRPLRDVAGITFLDNGQLVATPDRPVEDLNGFPPPAYDLIDPSRYIVQAAPGVRMAGGIYSRGCPYACDFCLDSRNKVHALSIDRIVADMEFWAAQGANHLRIYDGNFFLGRQRILDMCHAVLARGLPQRIRWAATGVGHRMARLDDEVLALLARAGLDQVAIGAESGSDELLRRITNKTTVADTTEAIRRLTRHGINAYLFFVIGYPDEPLSALDETFDLILRLKAINRNVEFFLNFTTPLPGSEVYRIAVARGLVEAPATFEAWSRFDYLQSNIVVAPGYEARVRRFMRYAALAFPKRGARSAAAETMKWPLRRLAHWRLVNRAFGWPLELAVQDWLRVRTAA